MSEIKKASLGQRWSDLQPSKTLLVWSCIGTAVVTIVVGFVWGGWVTGGTASDMAESAGEDGRYELASVICVEKFLGESDAQAQLAEFQAIGSSYRQRQFIEEGGWAVMPNKDEAARQSADLCAKVLAVLEPEALTPSTTTTAAEEPAAVVQ